MSARIKIELVFDVLDEDRLVSLAKEAIDQYGNGYECNPEDLADCAVELLLHSNPSIKSYDEYGLELIECVKWIRVDGEAVDGFFEGELKETS